MLSVAGCNQSGRPTPNSVILFPLAVKRDKSSQNVFELVAKNPFYLIIPCVFVSYGKESVRTRTVFPMRGSKANSDPKRLIRQRIEVFREYVPDCPRMKLL